MSPMVTPLAAGDHASPTGPVQTVSVLMTIFNPGPYLKPAIESLLAQSHRDFELIAIENGSTDGAKEIIRAYAEADPRIRLFDLPENIGRSPALNLALSRATGPLIAVLDADDLSHPQRLEKQVAYLRTHPEILAVGTWCDQIAPDGALIEVLRPPAEAAELRQSLAWQNPLVHSSIMYRRQVALEVGGYPLANPLCHDFALWLALAGRGELANLPERLTSWRLHPSNATFRPAQALSRMEEMIAVFERAVGLGGYGPEALRQSRLTLGRCRARYGLLLCLSGQGRAGLGELIRALTLNPWSFKDVPEIRRWTGVDRLSRVVRTLRTVCRHTNA